MCFCSIRNSLSCDISSQVEKNKLKGLRAILWTDLFELRVKQMWGVKNQMEVKYEVCLLALFKPAGDAGREMRWEVKRDPSESSLEFSSLLSSSSSHYNLQHSHPACFSFLLLLPSGFFIFSLHPVFWLWCHSKNTFFMSFLFFWNLSRLQIFSLFLLLQLCLSGILMWQGLHHSLTLFWAKEVLWRWAHRNH